MTQLAQQRTKKTSSKVIYTAKTHTTGGRENGASRSSDGRLDIKLSPPGSPRTGTNPEQLFAAGWSACFEGAMGVVAHKKKIKLPVDLAIDAEVDLNADDGRASTSPSLVSSGASPRASSKLRRRSVLTRRLQAATSPSPTT